jgi:hypothetical protein
MVCAVSDVVKEVPEGPRANSDGRGDVEEHALFAAAVELAQWCHRISDVDISRTEELANRLSVLHQALIDQVEDPHRLGTSRPTAIGPAAREIAERLHAHEQQLLATFARFVGQLRNGPLPFGNWADICDRLDELVAQFRTYVRTERDATRRESIRGTSARSSGNGDG